jgi:sugar/nucleoside kinase (ribokinase family)
LESPAHFVDALIAGHIVIDEIIDSQDQNSPRTSLGGPASYSSLALSSLGFKANIVSKVGEDFPIDYSNFLSAKTGLDIRRFVTKNEKTTRFKIDRSLEPRKMWLLAKCKNLSTLDFELSSEAEQSRPKALIVNGVAGEISLSLLDRIAKEFDYVFVDSQGFVRRFSKLKEVEMRSGLDISSLSGVDFLKADRTELSAWTGLNDTEASIRQLSKFVSNIILTSGPGFTEIFEGKNLKWRTKPPQVEITDTTGAGDIFLAVFGAMFSQTEKIRDSISLAICATSIALETKGIEKAVLDKQRVEKAKASVQVIEY